MTPYSTDSVKHTVRIRYVGGSWYAFASGQRKPRNLALVPAINFCRRLNAKAQGGAV